MCSRKMLWIPHLYFFSHSSISSLSICLSLIMFRHFMLERLMLILHGILLLNSKHSYLELLYQFYYPIPLFWNTRNLSKERVFPAFLRTGVDCWWVHGCAISGPQQIMWNCAEYKIIRKPTSTFQWNLKAPWFINRNPEYISPYGP